MTGQNQLQQLQQHTADLKGQHQQTALTTLAADFANIRAAWEWAIDHEEWHGISDAAEGLYWFGTMTGRFAAIDALFDPVRERAAPNHEGPLDPHNPRDRAWARVIVRNYAPTRLDPAHVQRALALAEASGDTAEAAYCLYAMAAAISRREGRSAGLPHFQRSLARYRTLGDAFYIARTLAGQAAIAIETARLNSETAAQVQEAQNGQQGQEEVAADPPCLGIGVVDAVEHDVLPGGVATLGRLDELEVGGDQLLDGGIGPATAQGLVKTDYCADVIATVGQFVRRLRKNRTLCVQHPGKVRIAFNVQCVGKSQ